MKKTNLAVSIAPIARVISPPNAVFYSPEPVSPMENNPLSSFPLQTYSNDHLGLEAVTIDDASASYFLTTDYKHFLKLMQICSLSPSDSKDLDLSTLLESISPDIINRLDQTQGAAPLHYACMNGNLPLVAFLLEHGAEPEIWNDNKQVTPLACAAAFGHLEICQHLMEHYQCDINAGLQHISGQTTALIWAVRGSNVPVVKFLLEQNASQLSLIPCTETPLHAAVISGSPEILEMLITAQGSSINSDLQMGPAKDTPIHLAASGRYPNSVAIAKILIEQGNAQVNVVNANNKTPLHLAAATHDAEMVKLLLSHWAKVDAVDGDGKTALFYMINDSEDALKSLEVLIKRGMCSINHQDKRGYTALHTAGLLGAAGAAEILLMNGADFSIKSFDGTSALSLLRRKISNMSALLTQVFNQAVTVTSFHDPSSSLPTGDRRDCKVKVNFACILPSRPTHVPPNPQQSPNEELCPIVRKPTRAGRFSSVLKSDQNPAVLYRRKETAKINCLINEEEDALLLHPVIHAFLEMKWNKARPIFLPTIVFKMVLVLLFSLYVQLPYLLVTRLLSPDAMNAAQANVSADCRIPNERTPRWFKGMYIAVLVMASIKIIMEFTQIIRAPKTLRTFHPWISLAVLLITIFYMSPKHWKGSRCPLQRSMAAVGILLAWIDIWIDMGRFPQFGLSIRVFFQVMKNFFVFITPHFYLLAGFLFSFNLIFVGFPEFSNFFLTLPKLVRIMAGDITIVSQSNPMLQPNDSLEKVASDLLLVYIYTAYVLIVAIVLSNLLIGLAVNDIQGIYAEASKDKLARQTLLLNTLESNFGGMWIRRWIPKLLGYTNLFHPTSESKIMVFKPYDSRDGTLSAEQKKALLDIATVTTATSSDTLKNGAHDESEDQVPPSKNIRVWKSAVSKLKTNGDNEQKILMDKIGELVAAFLKEKGRDAKEKEDVE